MYAYFDLPRFLDTRIVYSELCAPDTECDVVCLPGIPVYQQQLVHDSTELQDELCLEEYGIGSGAQLKLLLAMRGGPIHAHRGERQTGSERQTGREVERVANTLRSFPVQLEDPALLEIAEVLEATDCDHKYTIMLLRWVWPCSYIATSSSA